MPNFKATQSVKNVKYQSGTFQAIKTVKSIENQQKQVAQDKSMETYIEGKVNEILSKIENIFKDF